LRHFGGVAAVNLVNIAIEDRQVRSIIGPNGASKTTLINVMTGRPPATSGSVTYLDQDETGLAVHECVRQGLCRTFQITTVFKGLSAFENVRTPARPALPWAALSASSPSARRLQAGE